MAQNVYLYCASEDLATVIRAWLDRDALATALSKQPTALAAPADPQPRPQRH